MTPEEPAPYLRAVASGLAHAHARGVIHRDLKPDNVMITAEDRVKIMDFGIARSQEYSTLTATGMVMGTPACMPPEQVTGGRCDARSDQYSLGVMACELLTGRRPFQSDDVASLMFLHLTDDPPPPSLHRPDLPEAMEPFVLRLLQKEPGRRFPDMDAAARALDEALQGRWEESKPAPEQAGPVPPAPRGAPPSRAEGESTLVGPETRSKGRESGRA